MKWMFFLCLLVISVLCEFSGLQLLEEEFQLFTLKYNKVYQNAEERAFRMKVYLENRRKIAVHNQLYHQGLTTYTMAMNKFGDLLGHEFLQKMTGLSNFHKYDIRCNSTFLGYSNADIPDEIDWREKGYVTSVKDQGDCGSCYAFSAIGSLEGQHFKKTGNLVSLSVQQVVDCARGIYTHNDQGCHGGFIEPIFKYVMDNGGIVSDDTYPYVAQDEVSCRFSKEKVITTISGCSEIPTKNENKLKEAVATVGPISVAMEVLTSISFYYKGVYYDPECSSEYRDLNHAVLVVGYGHVEKGGDYWLIKNSWGADFDDHGFVKLARNRNNHCGIANNASFPLV